MSSNMDSLTNFTHIARGILSNLAGMNITFAPRPKEPPPFDPPTHLLQDYIELGCFLVILLVGTPLNVYVFIQQLREYRTLTKANKYDLNTAFLLHRIHLNVGNVMILLFHCTVQVGWLITYRWIAGDFVCKCVQFMYMVSFIISSNMVATIAADRLRNVLKLDKLTKGQGSNKSVMAGRDVMKPVKLMLWIAWATTILFSLPQWWVFGAITIMPDWDQCSTIWDRWRFEAVDPIIANTVFFSEKAYLIFHLLTIFWLPFVTICLCYITIVGKLLKFSCQSLETQTNEMSEMSPVRSVVIDSPSPAHSTVTSSFLDHPRLRTAGSSNYHGGAIPDWRNTMRSRMFRTAAAIVFVYTICWAPYNGLSLVIFFNLKLAATLSDHANWCKQLILLNVVLNPFLYGFRGGCQGVSQWLWNRVRSIFRRERHAPILL